MTVVLKEILKLFLLMNLVLGVQQKIINGVELFDQIILAIQKFKKKKKKKKIFFIILKYINKYF